MASLDHPAATRLEGHQHRTARSLGEPYAGDGAAIGHPTRMDSVASSNRTATLIAVRSGLPQSEPDGEPTVLAAQGGGSRLSTR